MTEERVRKVGPPRMPRDAAVDLSLVSPADLAELAEGAGLAIVAADLGDVADEVSFAFEGYAAARQRETNNATGTKRRDWAARLAERLRSVMESLGIDAQASLGGDRRSGTWDATGALTAPLRSMPEAMEVSYRRAGAVEKVVVSCFAAGGRVTGGAAACWDARRAVSSNSSSPARCAT